MKNTFNRLITRASFGRLQHRATIVLVGSTAAVLFLLIVLIAVGMYCSREPQVFDVTEVAAQRAAAQRAAAAPLATEEEEEEETQPPRLAPGYLTVSTQMHLVETLLDKPGGFLANDPLPPGNVLDNIPAWELGVLTQIRDFTLALRLDFSRAHAQSLDLPELNEAQARFAFSHEAWFLPSAETEYRTGLALLDTYTHKLTDGSASFTIRANALDEWLRKVERRLGGCSTQLRANAGIDKYNPNIMTSNQEHPDNVTGVAVSAYQVDNTFFEARGTAWAIYHLMKAIKVDYEPVLDNMLAMGALNRALSNLYAALQPVRSPMILNGREFGATPNHSLILSAYLANAHLAVTDLRALLTNS